MKINRRKIKAVIWDLGGVILRTADGYLNRTLARRLNVPLLEAERVMQSRENALWDLGEWDDDQFFSFMLRELGLPLHYREILERVYTQDCTIDRVMQAYVRGLAQTHLTALLTNFQAYVHALMRDVWRVDHLFQLIVASCDVKLLKPDPRIYYLTLNRLGVSAEEAVFIDDTLENVIAAQEVGMRVVHFQSRGQALAELELLLLGVV